MTQGSPPPPISKSSQKRKLPVGPSLRWCSLSTLGSCLTVLVVIFTLVPLFLLHPMLLLLDTRMDREPQQSLVSSSALSSSSSSSSLWKNRYNLVHVLKTRFMQFQPNLRHLGKARLEIFKTFTLPSVLHQSTKEFLWIIYTDPALHPDLLHELIMALEQQQQEQEHQQSSNNKNNSNINTLSLSSRTNILLVGSNHSSFEFFREESSSAVAFFYGNKQLWNDYQQAAQSHVLINSRLDADDAIYFDFMRQVQIRTHETMPLSQKKKKKKSQTAFRIFCVKHSLEWGYFHPLAPLRNNHKKNTGAANHGFLTSEKQVNFCLSAGLSFVFGVGTGPSGVVVAHHRIYDTFPKCRSGGKNDKNNKNKDDDDDEHHAINCIDRVPENMGDNRNDDDSKYEPVATLRSRTPTSNGMKGVLVEDRKVYKKWRHRQDEAWGMLEPLFSIQPKSVWKLHQILTDDMEMIVKDALHGQCSGREFSCKGSSKDQLHQLLQEIAPKQKQKHPQK